jgi:tetratricopeptide (TPR) repeat protein
VTRRGALLLVALLAAPATAQEPAAEQTAPTPVVDVDRAADLSAQALAALRAGEAKRAAELWEQASVLAPDAPELRYNRAVALERAGDRQAANEAYRQALTGDDGEHAVRSLFNLGALRLEDAWGAKDLLGKSDEDLLAAVREQGAGGDQQLPEQVRQAVHGLRGESAEKGIEAARDAVKRLRDLVRRRRGDREAVQNLELAQRTLRELKEELEKQQQAQQQQEQDAQAREQQDPAREDAEETLRRLLEAAARKAKDVREMRRARARRTPVEKDW